MLIINVKPFISFNKVTKGNDMANYNYILKKDNIF